MSSKDLRSIARDYLSREPVVNSYQLARLSEEESEVFLKGEEKPSGVLLRREGTITMRGRYEAIKELLAENIEKGDEYRFHAVDPNSFRAAQKLLKIEDDRPTWLLRREYEKPREPETEVEPLKEEDAQVINNYWGLSDSDSTDYIKERIEKGPAYGVRKEDELVGWSLTHFITDKTIVLGMLHIKEDWRRRGFAKDLTEKLCLIAEEKDLVPAVQIFKDNESSISLASDLGFEIRADHHWFTGS
ncbi:MAG: GNAT family N-acetyltransferase, partial [Candidatus Thermoplasmatota archaeon]|nr:GNAT family N-acetyltransferase [Candidatus Thermoplasmatota archaeon]